MPSRLQCGHSRSCQWSKGSSGRWPIACEPAVGAAQAAKSVRVCKALALLGSCLWIGRARAGTRSKRFATPCHPTDATPQFVEFLQRDRAPTLQPHRSRSMQPWWGAALAVPVVVAKGIMSARSRGNAVEGGSDRWAAGLACTIRGMHEPMQPDPTSSLPAPAPAAC